MSSALDLNEITPTHSSLTLTWILSSNVSGLQMP